MCILINYLIDVIILNFISKAISYKDKIKVLFHELFVIFFCFSNQRIYLSSKGIGFDLNVHLRNIFLSLFLNLKQISVKI